MRVFRAKEDNKLRFRTRDFIRLKMDKGAACDPGYPSFLGTDMRYVGSSIYQQNSCFFIAPRSSITQLSAEEILILKAPSVGFRANEITITKSKPDPTGNYDEILQQYHIATSEDIQRIENRQKENVDECHSSWKLEEKTRKAAVRCVNQRVDELEKRLSILEDKQEHMVAWFSLKEEVQGINGRETIHNNIELRLDAPDITLTSRNLYWERVFFEQGQEEVCLTTVASTKEIDILHKEKEAMEERLKKRITQLEEEKTHQERRISILEGQIQHMIGYFQLKGDCISQETQQ